MIIQCPACTTRYAVPDTAIGVDGRTVRCAKCRHSWFQDGPELDLADRDDGVEGEQPSSAPPPAPPPTSPPPPAPPEADARDRGSTQVPAAAIGAASADVEAPATDTKPTEPAPPEPIGADPAQSDPPLPEPPSAQPEGPSTSSLRDEIRPQRASPADFGDPPASAFDPEPPFRPRRNPLKVWTWAAGIFAVVAAGLIFAVSYWGLPDWVPVESPTFAVGEPDLQLDFPREQQERRTLPNGTEFFGASGSITNIGTTTRTIPTILIVMRDSRDSIVYSWEVSPPQRTIAPGENVPVSEAVTDIPRRARVVQIGWKPE